MADNEGEAAENTEQLTGETTETTVEEGRTSAVEEPTASPEKLETDDGPTAIDEADKTASDEQAVSDTPVAEATDAEALAQDEETTDQGHADAEVAGDVAAGDTAGEGDEKKDGEDEKGEKPEGEEFREKEEEAAVDVADEDEDANLEERDTLVEDAQEGVGDTEAATQDETVSPVPQSDTLPESEQPPSWETVHIGEKLSREPTPEFEGINILPSFLLPGTPERRLLGLDGPAPEVEPEKEPETEGPKYDREALLEKYHMALTEREGQLQQNNQLQNKLGEYFRKKKSDDRQDHDKNVTDQEQRYLKYMAQLDELHLQHEAEKQRYQQLIEELKARCEEKRQHVDAEHTRFAEFKKQIACNAINSRSGKPIAPKDIEQFLVNENKKEQEVVSVRLENIKLKNRLKKKEQQLKSKEELAEGLHLIDFEQLKIENQTYNEKIEERNEELLKLRKKITSTVQVLTHLKEKLQFVQAENQVRKGELMEVEAQAAQKRDILSRTKQARDALRIDNVKQRQNCGLLGNMALLRDFQERKDEDEKLCATLERLKMQHAELTLTCHQVRQKIEEARFPLL